LLPDDTSTSDVTPIEHSLRVLAFAIRIA
jgi:hypothetical protein